jgi:hypothetical protein
MKCKSGVLTLNGGKYSNSKMNTLSIGKMENALMFLVERILKDKKLLPGRDTMEPIKDGKLFMLILLRLKPRDSMKNSDSTSTDHSTLSLNFHSTELLRCTVMPTCG